MCQAFGPSLVSSATENKITASTRLRRVLHAECEFARVVFTSRVLCSHRACCVHVARVVFTSRVLCSRRACCARVVVTASTCLRQMLCVVCIQVSFCTERTCSGVWFSRRTFILQIHGQLPTEHTQGVIRLIPFGGSWPCVHVHCRRPYIR